MATVLLYNFTDRDRLMKLKFLLYKLGITGREVAAAELEAPIGALLGLAGYETAGNYAGPGFAEEMLVMHALSKPQFSALLDGLRQAGVTVSLKAVVTDTNAAWDSLRLHRELSAEHAAMSRMKKSVHKSKR